mgnify:CR=1 FL=1
MKRLDEFKDLNIVFFTRSCNKNLYELSGKTIKLPFKRIPLRFTTADGYFYSMIKYKVDIAINIDEDAFIFDNDLLVELLRFFLNNNYVNCGFPDGGVLPIRYHNPLITNPFFNIIDLRVLREKFSYKLIDYYRVFKDEYKEKTPSHLLKSDYNYDMYEPYYPFFLWISQNYKVLYLDAEVHHDGISTVLKDHKNNPFLFHSWYSRTYGIDEMHTNRINSLITECGVNPQNLKINQLERFKNANVFPYYVLTRKVLKKIGILKYV